MSRSLHTTRTTIGATAGVALLFAAPAFAGPPTYEVLELGSIEADGSSVAWGINDSGHVVGESVDVLGERRHAFLFADGVMHDLGILGGDPLTADSVANAINSSGEVAGTSDNGEFQSAFLHRDGIMEDIGNLGGPIPVSAGYDINDAGEVTGASISAEGTAAFLYTGGVMQRVDLVPDACTGFPYVGYGINNRSELTGYVYVPVPGGCLNVAYLYSDGGMLAIGALLPGFSSTGYAINDSGQVVIHAIGTGESGGYLYSDGSMERIGDMIPWGINNSGWVVGETGLGGEDAHALLYIDGELFDLNGLVADLSRWRHLQSARGINDAGQIAGFGRTADGLRRAFLLTPVALLVKIDVRPGSVHNPVNLASSGTIPVAVLSSESFDALQVDWESVTFGPSGAREAHGRSHVEDVDRDGDLDFVLHFATRETGIRCGDTEAALAGTTFANEAFRGTDAITVKCSPAQGPAQGRL